MLRRPNESDHTARGRTTQTGEFLNRLFGFDRSDEDWLVRVREARSAQASPVMLGEFEVLQEAGRGGQGVVFKAIQPRTGRLVALKRLSAGAFATPAMLARFEREVEASASLNHPGIVSTYGCELLDGQPVLSMEWIDGRQIDAWAGVGSSGEQRSLNAVIALFVELCSAVHHAHQRGVIHRDLKPSNVLIDADDRPHVLDFGLAKLMHDPGGDLTRSGQFMGTLAFAAPEQLRGVPAEVDVRTDVYSLGVMLYLCLSGRLPFESGGRVAPLIKAIEQDDPLRPSRWNSRIDRELDAIVLKALRKDPAARYASVESMRVDLARYLAGEPVNAHPPTRLYRARKFVGRHRVGVSAGSLFVLLLAAATVFSSRMYFLASESASRAESEASQVRSAIDLMRGWLVAGFPEQHALGEPRMRDMLAIAAAQLDDAALRSDLRHDLRVTLGRSYLSIGLFEVAAEEFERAKRDGAPDAYAMLGNEILLAEARYRSGDFAEAERLLTNVAAAAQSDDQLRMLLPRVPCSGHGCIWQRASEMRHLPSCSVSWIKPKSNFPRTIDPAPSMRWPS